MSNSTQPERRLRGRPMNTSRDIAGRHKQWALGEKCAALTDEGIAFAASVLRNEPQECRMPNGETVYEAPTISHRTEIWKIILDRGFGRPLQAVQVDQQSASKIIHEVRWLPPDPNDHSKVIEPEP